MSIPLGILAARPMVSAGWTPADLAGLHCWYAADEIAGLSDTDAVSSWPDLSPNGFTLTTDPAGGPATYRTGIRDGKPVVRFDGVNDTLSAVNILEGITTYEITAVLAVTGGAAIAVPISNQRFVSSRTGGAMILNAARTRGMYSPGSYATYTGGTYTNGTWERWAFASNATLYVNGSSVQTAAAAGTGGTLLLGGATSTSGTRVLQFPTPMDVAEVVVTDAVLSAPDRATLDTYLADKWGL